MRKTLDRNKDDEKKICVNVETLAQMLDCGRATAVKIGTDAGAKFNIGRRAFYKVSVIEEYLDTLLSK